MEKKVDLFDTKNQKKKQKASNSPMNQTSSTNTKINLFSSKPKESIKVKKHIDLNYVKMDRILNFYRLNGTNSKITCHGRPTPKQVKSMRQMYKVNYCLTLQKIKENPQDVQKYCQDNGIEWQLIELDGANVSYLKRKDVLSRIVDSLIIVCQKLISDNLILFIHCAAGLHRTGTVLYTLLRVFGETPETAMIAIGIIREDTHREVGVERIKIAENYIFPEIMKKLKELNTNIESLTLKDKKYIKENKLVDEKSNNNNLLEELTIIDEKHINDHQENLEINKKINYTKLINLDNEKITSNNIIFNYVNNFNREKDEKIQNIFEDLDS